jgi:hypothetical protein
MNILIFVPAFLVFIYCLYRLVKDDYVFIRKNVSSEQMFDIAFVITWIGLFFSRLFFFVLHSLRDANILTSFFSVQANEFSLFGLVLGGIGGLYLAGRYKKLPINRLFDFFATAFAVALPVGFLTSTLFFKEYVLLLYFINAVIYSFFAYYLIKYFQPKFIVFILFFSSVSLVDSLILQFLNKSSLIDIENILLLLAMITSLVFFFKRK